MRRRLLVGVLATAFALGASTSLRVEAQPALQVQSNEAQSTFPDGITFTLSASLSGALDDARLRYEIAPDGVRTTAVPECTEGQLLHCSFTLASTRRNFLIPGAEVTYTWRLRTVDGRSEETPPQVVTYEDDRFDWQTVSEGNLTVWWYVGDEAEARDVLTAGRESLDRISALLRTQVPFPVKIFYYGSAQDMQPAILPTFAEGVVTAGEVVYSDTAMVARGGAAEDIARHEIAHVVIRQAVRPPHDLPAWLNEGTATYAQSVSFSDQEDALDRAIRSNRVLSVRSLSSQSSGAGAGTVSLFYAQSRALVAFLVERYGEEKFAQLFQAFNEGRTTEEALQQVYGFNQDGLENAWRESVGLPPRVAPTPQREQAPDTPEVAGPDDQPAPAESNGNGGGASIGLLVGIAAVTALIAGGLVIGGVALARRWR